MKFRLIQTLSRILDINTLNFKAMNKKLLYLAFIGLLGLSSSCEKDETKVVMSASPIAPTIQTMPNLTLQRTNGTSILEFVGTPVDPGFEASANYFLEASASGTNFANPIVLVSDIQPTSLKISVSDLNGILIRTFPTDVATSIDFRIRSVLVVDAGTGAPGTSTAPFTYNSEIKTASVTTYGLPRLDLIDSGIAQKVESALGDGKYTGFVKLDVTKPFTLRNPDTNTAYGSTGGKLAVNGAGIAVQTGGWNKLDVDLNALTYTVAPYSVGVVGAFTDWGGSPDHVMDFDIAKGHWFITLNLPVGPMKFRLNSAWDVNWGPDGDKDLPAGGGMLPLPNSSGNINITAAGNYTIHVTVSGSSGSCTFIKNN
jgi:starch-binding outer membrane protein SusE/F